MTNRLGRHLAAFAAAVLIAAGVATSAGACSAGAVAYPQPASWTVMYQGTCYAGYQYDVHELDMYGGIAPSCVRVVYPSFSASVVAGTLNAALLGYLTEYSSFFHSGFWFDQYYAPMGARYHVTLIARQSYTSNSAQFESKYASQIKTNSAKASWSGAKTGTYKFPATNAKAKNKPLTNTNAGTGGGGVGTDNSRSGPLTNQPKPAAPKPAAPKPAAPRAGRR